MCPSSVFSLSGDAFGSCMTWPKCVSSRIACTTSSSCKGTMPPLQVPLPPAPACATPEIGTLGTEPSGAPPGSPEPPELAPCAAAINCKSFCGSLSHCLNSGPMDCAASCAAIESSPVVGSAATNLTSLMRIDCVLLSESVSLICLAKSCAFEPPMAKARTSRVKSSSVTLFENRMLESPAALSNCAKLRSACPVSRGMPSRSNLSSDTPSTNPLSCVLGIASCSSFHAVSNCPAVLL